MESTIIADVRRAARWEGWRGCKECVTWSGWGPRFCRTIIDRVLKLDALRAERRDEILRLAQKRGAHSLRVFGSVARGEANENSDLDLLVAWEPGRSLLDHAGLVEDLQDLLGVKVHVGTEKSLHWYVRDRILREATPL